MPVSCFTSSAPASQGRENGSCFGALLKACKRSRSAGWDADQTDEFEKNPNFQRTSEDEFHKLYKVKKTIGVGGFSIVRKGKHIPTGQDVAIKVIDRSKYDPSDGSLEAEIVVLDKVPSRDFDNPPLVCSLPTLQKQVKPYCSVIEKGGHVVHAQVHHPYCISFKECYFTRKHVYVITELVTGGELLDRVLNKGKYGEQKAAQIMKQLLEGVAYLHSIGVVHRDLKLENILLKSPDEDSPIKIADFGLSKIFAGAAPLTTICGSPQYVAPEVLEVGQKRLCYTPAADLWSTGVIMYILLSGYSPFDDANEAILFQKIRKGMYSMKQPVWETVSYQGKDLMRRLLITIPEKRLTARQALQHPWFKMMILDNPKEDHPGMSGEVVMEQYTEARKEKLDDDERQVPATQETEPGQVPGTSTNNLESQGNIPVQQEMSDKSKENIVLQAIDEKPPTVVQDIDERPQTAVQEIGDKLGTVVQEIDEKLQTVVQEIDEQPQTAVQEIGDKLGTAIQEIGEKLGTLIQEIGKTGEPITVQDLQEPTDDGVQERSQGEIRNITETETRPPL